MAVRVPRIERGILRTSRTMALLRSVDEADNALVVLYAQRRGSRDDFMHPGGLAMTPLVSWVTARVSR